MNGKMLVVKAPTESVLQFSDAESNKNKTETYAFESMKSQFSYHGINVNHVMFLLRLKFAGGGDKGLEQALEKLVAHFHSSGFPLDNCTYLSFLMKIPLDLLLLRKQSDTPCNRQKLTACLLLLPDLSGGNKFSLPPEIREIAL